MPTNSGSQPPRNTPRHTPPASSEPELPSPQTAIQYAVIYRRSRQPPRERWLRVAGLVGTMLVHLMVLFGMVLGSAYDIDEAAPPPATALQVRLIDSAETPPPPTPPARRGPTPKKVGARHRGHTASVRVPKKTAAATSPRAASLAAHERVAPAALPLPPVPPMPPARSEPPRVTAQPPAAAPRVTASKTSRPSAPAAHHRVSIEPIPTAAAPPVVMLDSPSVPQPEPTRFQPEPARKPQIEGNQPIIPPASLALPEVPAAAAPTTAVADIVMDVGAAVAKAPRAAPAARPHPAEEPALKPETIDSIPLLAPTAPQISPPLPARSPTVAVPRATATLVQPAPAPVTELPAIEHADTEVAVPVAPVLDMQSARADASVLPARLRPQVSVAAASVDAEKAPKLATDAASALVAPANSASASVPASPAAAASVAAIAEATPASDAAAAATDVSSAPDASPQGRDDAEPGSSPAAAASASASAEASGQSSAAASTNVVENDQNRGLRATDHGHGERGRAERGRGEREQTGSGQDQPGPGEKGRAEPGAATGERTPAPGSYVQLVPRGNPNVMSHRRPDIGYRSTRFANDWTPAGESSIDTAVRHAVEKTTIKHTFHLPRGVRVECKVMPLMPFGQFVCGSADPPPKPVADKVYERMHLAPANPLVAPSPARSAATTVVAPVAPIQLDHRAECAGARISGGPQPPFCADASAVVPAPAVPATTSGSWVPASDQFH